MLGKLDSSIMLVLNVVISHIGILILATTHHLLKLGIMLGYH